MGNVVKGIGRAVGGIARVAAPIAGFIPGIGPIAQAGLGILGGLGASKIPGVAGAFKPQVGATQNAASPFAGQYTNFLSQFLGGGNQNQMVQTIQNMLSGRPGDPTDLSQYFGAGMGGTGGADVGQVDTSFAPTPINVGYTPPTIDSSFTPEQLNTLINAQMIPGGGFDPTSIMGDYSPTSFASGFDPSQIAALAPLFQGANLTGVNTNAPNFSPVGDVNFAGLPALQRELLATDPNFGRTAGLDSIINPAANTEAIRAIMGDQQTRDIADLRERFGNRALSTGAQQAEAAYRAQAAPRTALAIDEINRQNNQLALQQRGQDLQNFLESRGLDTSQINTLNQLLVGQRGQDVGAATSGAGLSLEAQRANQAAGLTGNAQQIEVMRAINDAILGGNQQQLTAAGQQNAFNQDQFQTLADLFKFGTTSGLDAARMAESSRQFGAQFGQESQTLNNQFAQAAAEQQLRALIANQGAGLDAARIGQAGGIANMEAMLNAARLNQAGQIAGGQFGVDYARLAQSGQLANLQAAIDAARLNQTGGIANQDAMLRNQQMMNQWNLGLQGVGADRERTDLSRDQMASEQQRAMLEMLFRGFGQTQALGMPQAETTVGPSTVSQVAGGAGAIGQIMDAINKAKGMRTPATSPIPINMPAPAIRVTPNNFMPTIRPPSPIPFPISF